MEFEDPLFSEEQMEAIRLADEHDRAFPPTMITIKGETRSWEIAENALKKDCKYFKAALTVREEQAFSEALTKVFEFSDLDDDALNTFFFLVKYHARCGRCPDLMWVPLYQGVLVDEPEEATLYKLMQFVEGCAKLYITADYFDHPDIKSFALTNFDSCVGRVAVQLCYDKPRKGFEEPITSFVISFFFEVFELLEQRGAPYEHLQENMLLQLSRIATGEAIADMLALADENFIRKFTRALLKQRSDVLKKHKAACVCRRR